MDKLNELTDRVKILEEKVKKLENNTICGQKNINVGTTGAKTISEKEFVLQYKPKDDVQRTFLLGAYLETVKNRESFTAKQLEQTFRAAKEPVPKNINDKINKNVAKGLLMNGLPVDGKKSWVLTASGEAILSKKNG